ncbi:MAG: undecaprenyl-diphosphatase UppP [Candidatus Sungbacteria bacterium RIFCSPLOWO2_01_FULL_47_10]|uniref:Undecaprenyl-diphosphatase n=1 Tax=Candidatus Sungbacteria bacterium RIFCSPLOWO2_01_FULL_47_10 TaxID=1802276 RepID=A0A1G2KYT6_9BACT|nr:MAG: undecaprenyl-diphosphatase UppP [Candidatus Sungbacteria bacterium RIFCSPLOWO2_01_FULL_47_10]
MTIANAIILGIVEGVTEYLPISSTGHLILASDILGLTSGDFVRTFEISIQLGAILAVAVLYWRRFFIDRSMVKKILVAFVPTALVGFAMYAVIKSVLLGSTAVVLWSLFFGGIALILFEHWYKEKEHLTRSLDTVTYRQSFFIGLAQSASVIPGISRAAATILGGLFIGLDRKTVVEFSFLLAVPTMAAATGYDLFKSAGGFMFDDFRLLFIGLTTSFGVAVLAVKFFLRYIESHSFVAFGIYRIAVSLGFWIFFFH